MARKTHLFRDLRKTQFERQVRSAKLLSRGGGESAICSGESCSCKKRRCSSLLRLGDDLNGGTVPRIEAAVSARGKCTARIWTPKAP